MEIVQHGPSLGVEADKKRESKNAKQREYYQQHIEKYRQYARDHNVYVPHPKPLATHCKQGHEYTAENTYTYSLTKNPTKTVRQCKACGLEKRQCRSSVIRGNHLKRKFGITLEQYDAMLLSQGNCCAVCKSPEPGGMGSFHVDHCHDTGKIRSLLCIMCNTALGRVKDNPELLEALAAYVRQHRPDNLSI